MKCRINTRLSGRLQLLVIPVVFDNKIFFSSLDYLYFNNRKYVNFTSRY